MEFQLKKVEGVILARTAYEWHAQLDSLDGADIFPPAYTQALGWAAGEGGVDGKPDCHSFGLIRTSEDYACALAEIVHATHHPEGSMVRLLSVRLEPRLDLGLGIEPGRLSEIIDVSAAMVVQSLGLSLGELPADLTKIRGATPLTVELLSGVADALRRHGVECSLSGSWLVVRS